jgi:hypothetical protein
MMNDKVCVIFVKYSRMWLDCMTRLSHYFGSNITNSLGWVPQPSQMIFWGLVGAQEANMAESTNPPVYENQKYGDKRNW